MMTFIKFITFLWPFLKEMILGDKTLREALRHHMARLLLIGLILLSVALNFFTVPKLLSISYEYIELKRKYEHLSQVEAAAPAPQQASSGPPGSVETAPVGANEQYRRTKEFFDRLREKEKAAH